MKVSELQKVLIKCVNQWGDREVHLEVLHDKEHESLAVESIEFDGDKIILGDLTRAQDNWANAEDTPSQEV